MLKLTKTGIGLLTKQYRSVLRKCLLLNFLGFTFVTQSYATFQINYGTNDGYYDLSYKTYLYYGEHTNSIDWSSGQKVNVYTTSDFSISDYYTKAQTDALLNYYYTFRVDERAEVTDSASFFQKDFSTLQKVDLQSKNPTHLGAFTKCDEVCSRPSERFSLSLSQEQMLKNDASVDAGTSQHCLRQFGDVVADLLKNTAAKGPRMYEFMNEEVCHA